MEGRENLFYGEKLLQLLKKKGLTEADAARLVGIARDRLCRYINHNRNPRRDMVQRIADALHVPINEISGYDPELAVPDVAKTFTDSDALLTDVCRFVATELSHQSEMTTQSSVASKIGISAPQVSHLLTGKADIRDFPLSALVKLCPQIINREALTGGNADEAAELASVVENIRRLAGKITDIATARTVETMLKGLVEKE